MYENYRKALGSLIATFLFLLLAIISVTQLQTITSLGTDILKERTTGNELTGNVEIMGVYGSELYLSPSDNESVRIRTINVNGEICHSNLSLSAKQQRIFLSPCVSSFKEGRNELVLISENGVRRNTFYVSKNEIEGLISTENGPVIVNTTSDWQTGIFTNTRAFAGNLFLGSSKERILGLLTHWEFEGNLSDGKALDNSSNGIHAQPIGFEGDETGKQGIFSSQTFQFDGDDDVLKVPSNSSLNFSGGDAFSFSLWLKSDVTGYYKTALSKGSWDNPPALIVQTTPGDRIRFALKDNTGTHRLLDSSTIIQSGEWYHIAVSYDGNNAALYIDGVEEVSVSADLESFAHQQQFYIGSHYRTPSIGLYQNWTGKLDDMMIFNHSLNDSEVGALSLGTSPYQGNYTSSLLADESSYEWDTVEAKAEIPSSSSLNLSIFMYNSTGGESVQKTISLVNGTNDYTMDMTSQGGIKFYLEGESSRINTSWSLSYLKFISE